MARKSSQGLPAGIQFSGGFYLATLAGKYAKQWRERHPGRSLPRRRLRNLDDAVDAQRELIADLKAGKDPNADNPTISTWVETWIASRKKLAASTRRRYTQSWKYQIKPLKLGRLRLRQTSREQIEEWVNVLVLLARQDDGSKLLSSHSIRNAFAVLRAALNDVVMRGLIPANPCKSVELPEAEDDEILPMTPGEVSIFLTLIDTYELDRATGLHHLHRQAALYHVAIRCGFRLSELLGLRLQDYDSKQREIRIRGQLQDGRRKKKGKTKKALRTVPVSVDVARALDTHLRNLAEEQRLNGPEWNKAGLLFVSENGTPLSPSNVWRSYTALQRRAGLADTCHTCNGSGKVGTAKKAPKCEECNGHGVIARFRFHVLMR